MGESEELGRRPRLILRRRRPETNPLFLAVTKNDLEELKGLVASGKSVNTTNSRGNTLLNYIISHQRFEMFDYLLSCDGIEIDCVNTYGQNSLLFTATDTFDEHFALELIKKGANIHATDDAGFTFLHLAIKYTGDNSLKLGQLVVEKGINIDAQACYGVTALYAACEEGCFNWIYMLLYYGASALIPSDNGILPVAVLSPTIPPDQYVHLEQILFNHTFDDVEVSVRLPTLVAAMSLDSSLFSKIVNVASDTISYDMSDLRSLYSFLIHVKAKHFRLFVQKFGEILNEMIGNFSPLTMLVSLGVDLDLPELREILWIFLESEYVSKFVQTSDLLYPTIGRLVQMFNKQEMFLEEEEITRMVCIMLTYGLNVTSSDLDTVYLYYGYCQLFKILLHMDVQIVNYASKEYPVAALYYDFNTDIQVYFNELSVSSKLLSYYNHPRFKEICSNGFVDEETFAKAESLPPVPYLIELSRNAARKHIVSRYKIKNCMQFYTVLKWLPIGEMTKRIIALEEELY